MPYGPMSKSSLLSGGNLLEKKKAVKTKKKKDWYSKVNLRPHFDLPKRNYIAEQIVSSKNVARHKFFPFLNFTIKSFKIKKKLELKRLGDEKGNPYKTREINYSCHSDAYIFSFYNSLLIKEYEIFLESNNLDNVIAYRAIKKTIIDKRTSKEKEVGKSNIDFAAEAFLEIEQREDCYCIGLDIKGFFDNLDHELLYKNLCKVLNVKILAKDWNKIYRVLTDFHFIKQEDILKHKLVNLTKEELWDDENKMFKKICTPDTLSKIIADDETIVNNNPKIEEKKGIPQGTNISGTFANIYMLDFDLNMKKYIESNNGYYRRYSDDILIIVNSKDLLEKTIDLIKNELEKIKLNLSENKTICCHFQKEECKSISCSLRQEPDKEDSLQYLGFTYNGKYIRVRNGTLGKFWIEAIKHTKKMVLGNAFNDKVVPIAKIYGLYSHLNNREADFYGNFYGYIRHAQKVFENEYNFGDKVKIKKQMSNSWDVLHRYLDKLKKRYKIKDRLLPI